MPPVGRRRGALACSTGESDGHGTVRAAGANLEPAPRLRRVALDELDEHFWWSIGDGERRLPVSGATSRSADRPHLHAIPVEISLLRAPWREFR